MEKTWGIVRDFLPMIAIILLCMLLVPATQAHAEDISTNNNGTAATTAQQQQLSPVASEQKAAVTKEKAKTTPPKPRDKSVLDAEVLESPLAYFKNAFTSEDEESDEVASGSGVVMITVKALIATLLSTVM